MTEEIQAAAEQAAQGPPGQAARASPARDRPTKKRKSTVQLLLAFLLKLAVIAAAIWAMLSFVLGVTIHYGNNMYPAIRDGDLIVAYSGNIGYFTIPDETKVVIEYEAVVLQTTAGLCNTSNEVRMLQYSKKVDDIVDHGGAGDSSATNPSILVKKYASGHMERGLNGAQFQLFTYNHATYERGDSNTAADWTPVMLTKPEGQPPHPAIFTTQNLTVDETNYGDGYVEIELSQDRDGMTLQTGTVYGLREVTKPTSLSTNGDTITYQDPHNADFYCYVFSICGDDETADYTNFIYLPMTP